MVGGPRGRLTLVGASAVAALAGLAAAAPATPGPGSATITVSDSACAPGWIAPRSGRTTFTIENESPSTPYTVSLVAGEGREDLRRRP